MSPPSDDFTQVCVGFFRDAAVLLGLPASIGTVYGLLYASPTPLSHSDLFDRLDLSRGSVSQGLNFLRRLDLVHPATPTAFPRRAYFVPVLCLRRLIRRLWHERAALATNAPSGLTRLRDLADRSGPLRRFRRSRVARLETWRRHLQSSQPEPAARRSPTTGKGAPSLPLPLPPPVGPAPRANRNQPPSVFPVSVTGCSRSRPNFVHLCLNRPPPCAIPPSVSTLIEASPPAVPRPPAADAFSRECVEFFGEAVLLFGVPNSVGQIYGLLYSSPAPLSFSDIFEQLEISKGSVSQGLSFLRALGAVHAVTSLHGNGRREFFEPELSLRKLLHGVLDERVGPLARQTTDRLARLQQLAGAGDGRQRKFQMGRVRQLETWQRRLKTVMPVLTALLGPKA
jgi:DNA-binding transcriptional regulator GbsR (MarR family)